MNSGAVDTQSKASDQQISMPSISLPSGGGALRGMGETFAAQDFTGTANFSLPLQVPQARHQGPDLKLSYSSGGGNGTFGIGFQLSLSSVGRKTNNGIPRYDDTDIFSLTDEGDLAPALVWNDVKKEWAPETRLEPQPNPVWRVIGYRPINEGPFARIEQWIKLNNAESHWRVLTRDNTTHCYGLTEAARIFDPHYPVRIFQWLIEETVDSLGNRITYHYKPEDEINLPAAVHEEGRDHRTNRYISKIEYGNYFAGSDEHFAFQILFDYGEFSISNPNGVGDGWIVRRDPFSSYRSGFEIRTLRLCSNILIYHCFHDQFEGEPFLTRALSFEYEQASDLSSASPPGLDLSFIKSVTDVGFKRQGDGSYLQKELPPLVFAYSGFDPMSQDFRELKIEGDGSLPGNLNPGQYQLVDLKGEGLPGILYSDDVTVLQWQPEGEGRFTGPRTPDHFPLNGDWRNTQLSITSLDGNGEPDLLVITPTESGFYEVTDTAEWSAFQPFKSAPLDITNPDAQLLDVDGDGRADLLIFENDFIRTYKSKGLEGFSGPDVAIKEPGFPAVESGGAEEFVTFADVFGDGLSHRVRIRNGMVEVWPNLGYGQFGRRVVMGNAPMFSSALDASRVLLADLDGSGTDDLIYLYPDHIQIFFNQSGNSFSDPIEIALPAPYDELSKVNFADINGNGTSCFVLTCLGTEVSHHYYDFAGDLKPYLLTEVNNNLGSITRVGYTTSVKQYLEDKREGRTWATRLYFPVQVVERIEHRDEISGSRAVTRHKYHDGYYDPVDREFRGFGYVETWDTETFEEFLAATRVPTSPAPNVGGDLYVPPVYMRTWYQTGAFLDAKLLSQQYRQEHWKGDPLEHELPDSILAGEIYEQDSETLRQAYAALAGQMLRQETYGQDNSALAVNPYTVAETNAMVRLIQPRQGSQYAVFFTYERERLNYNYERNPVDPCVQQNFALVVDDFGNTRLNCSVFYPRRSGAGANICPEQESLKVVVLQEEFINHLDTKQEPYRWLGVVDESREYQLEGLTPSNYFLFEDIATQVENALQSPLPFGEPFAPGTLQARLFTWRRDYQWNEAQSDAGPLGKISARGLRHHNEAAVFTPQFCNTVLKNRVNSDQLTNEAGYWLNDGYWWNRGLIQHFFKEPERFFQTSRVDGAFAEVDFERNLNPTTTVKYDAYCLLPVQTTQYLKGQPDVIDPNTITLVIQVENDYRVLKPWRYIDPNGNTSEFLFDPLAMVMVTTLYGTEGGDPVGDDPLDTYTLLPEPSFAQIIDEPETYLQQASTFSLYDYDAWRDRGEPATTVTLQRTQFLHDFPPRLVDLQIRIAVGFTDGFGRVVENRLQTDPGLIADLDAPPAPGGKLSYVDAHDRWIVSGRTVYNNKGTPAEQYRPWFSSSPNFDALWKARQTLLPRPTVFHYDPLQRPVRVDTPKGFFLKTEYFAWQVKTYDEDDTVKDSTFYQDFFAHPIPPDKENERDALDKAARFFNTPSISVLDNLGRTVRRVENNLGAVPPSDFDEIVQGSGITAQQLWDQLVAAGYLKPDDEDPTIAWTTDKLQPYNAQFQQLFAQEFGALAAPVLQLLKTNGLITLHELEISGLEIRSTDPRLFYSNVTKGTDYHNLVYVYDMLGVELARTSSDAGANLSLKNIFGGTYWNFSPRNFEQIITYDRLQRRAEVQVKGFKNDGTLVSDNLVEIFTYGESHDESENYNLRGQLYQLQDQSGMVTNSRYNLQADVQETLRQFTVEYKEAINWAEDVPLEIEIYTTQFSYDVFHQVLTETTPDNSTIENAYSQSGQLKSIEVSYKDGTTQSIVKQIDYNASDQRLFISYANGSSTGYEYEELTQRLLRLFSTRSDKTAKGNARVSILQDITYTYDPVGNVTRSYDYTYETVFHNNQAVEPLSDYRYDPLYHLLEANGRQHPGINATTFRNNEKDGDFKQSKLYVLPNDVAALETYRERYSYDDAGNLLITKHLASNSWSYNREIMPDSNRLKTVGEANGINYSNPIPYDNSGNQTQLDINNAVRLVWNCCENLISARIIERPDQPDDADYYTYDSDELRTRKVLERLANGSVVQKTVTLYLGNFEITLLKSDNQIRETTILERHSLRVKDNLNCVVNINYWPQDDRRREVEAPGTRRLRYQLNNQLGSVAMELDGDAQLISYEEYFPYGGTAFVAGKDRQEVDLKTYRYSGKECDDSTGLYYYGARYYSTWLGRWLKPDPIGPVDGLNLYLFVSGNPIGLFDDLGYSSESRFFQYNKGKFTGIKGKRPTNQNSEKTQKKVAERLGSASVTLPQHMEDFVDQVETNGKADLTALGCDMCHVTAADKMKETLNAALNTKDEKPSKKLKRQREKLKQAVEETISSDEESDREEQVEAVVKALDPKTDPEEAMELIDGVLNRVNRSSRNLRPDHNRTNRGIGNSKDPFLLPSTTDTKYEEEERSKGINDLWNEVREEFGLAEDVPKTDKKSNKRFKSSSISAVPGSSFGEISSNTFQL